MCLRRAVFIQTANLVAIGSWAASSGTTFSWTDCCIWYILKNVNNFYPLFKSNLFLLFYHLRTWWAAIGFLSRNFFTSSQLKPSWHFIVAFSLKNFFLNIRKQFLLSWLIFYEWSKFWKVALSSVIYLINHLTLFTYIENIFKTIKIYICTPSQ